MIIIKKDVINVKPEIVLDYFVYKDDIIAILDNEAFPSLDEDVTIFARITEEGDSFYIKPIDEIEYEEIAKYYSKLQNFYKD